MWAKEMFIFNVLDFLFRVIIIPGTLLFMFSSVPQIRKDIKEFAKLIFSRDKRVRRKKRKTAYVQSRSKVAYTNSFSYSQSNI
ncbi:MAG: hypothetical protein N4A54_04070 [Peptostreptococcaceae bacterium]|jgi:hypothetical protein|nr:hypothetical protein [Peptostreptococcaceae bacterium]